MAATAAIDMYGQECYGSQIRARFPAIRTTIDKSFSMADNSHVGLNSPHWPGQVWDATSNDVANVPKYSACVCCKL